MFKSRNVTIPLRTFYVELKHRPPGITDPDEEVLVETLDLKVPRLKDSNMEKQWAIAQLWNRIYEPEYTNRGINQIFIFTAEGRELLMRLETSQFEDESCRKLSPPDATAFENWQNKVKKKFRHLYGITVQEWQYNSALAR